MENFSKKLLGSIDADLSITAPFSKGMSFPVRNCWHFCTDGNRIDQMFADAEDFRSGMNRIYVVLQKYRIMILAFVLMDTHVHFVLYGDFGQCNLFMHDYIRRTSMYQAERNNDRKKLADVPINHQIIDDDIYLKTAICYVLRNPLEARLPYNYYDYPWSSGALYFRGGGLWTSPAFTMEERTGVLNGLGFVESRKMLKSHIHDNTADKALSQARVINGMVHPADYVAVDVVERIFKTPRSLYYFMGRTREEDIESRGGALSRLSIPIQEMRQNRDALCKEILGRDSIRQLDVAQRIRLAKALKSRYNSSVKQIAKLCGLLYEEVKGII